MALRTAAQQLTCYLSCGTQSTIPHLWPVANHLPLHYRCLSTSIGCLDVVKDRVLLHGIHDLPLEPQGIIEMREYTAQPAAAKALLSLYAETASIRRRLSPFLGMFMADTGGSLTTIVHLYHYRDYEHRAQVRAAMAVDKEWQREAVDAARVMLQTQSSTVIRHSEVLHRAAEAGSAASFDPRAASPATGAAAVPAASTSTIVGSAAGDAAQATGVYMLLKHNTALHPLGWHPIPSTLGQAQAHGAQLVFAGLTELGVRCEAVELLRFDSVAALDACFQANWMRSQSLDPAEVVMLQPVATSPWQ